MSIDEARNSQKWMLAIAVPIFFALMGFLFWVSETSKRREVENTALAVRQTSGLTIEELVKCLRNDDIKGLSLAIPKRGGWLDKNTFILINNVWHVRVYLKRRGSHTEVHVFSRYGRLRADHRTIFEECIPGRL